jgi:hypothetical protein
MSDENDPYVAARRELARREPAGPTSRTGQQRRVIELMRRRASGSSLAVIYDRLQELERENEQLRRGAHHGPA